ncbi:uncharacterized protein [Malus domestica]|uniref:uncharacterized protein n=1 Tax=Malus domestica TaxID=3750 RepID=UPI0039760B12
MAASASSTSPLPALSIKSMTPRFAPKELLEPAIKGTLNKEAIQMVKPAKGTTSLAFIFKDGVMVAADSRASMGGYICLVKRDTNHVVGVSQVTELGDLAKEMIDKVVRKWKKIREREKGERSTGECSTNERAAEKLEHGEAQKNEHQRKHEHIEAEKEELERKKKEFEDMLVQNAAQMKELHKNLECGEAQKNEFRKKHEQSEAEKKKLRIKHEKSEVEKKELQKKLDQSEGLQKTHEESEAEKKELQIKQKKSKADKKEHQKKFEQSEVQNKELQKNHNQSEVQKQKLQKNLGQRDHKKLTNTEADETIFAQTGVKQEPMEHDRDDEDGHVMDNIQEKLEHMKEELDNAEALNTTLAIRPSPTLGLKAKFFSPENFAFCPETFFLFQPFWAKILARNY